MADAPKQGSEKKVTLFNRGRRHFDLGKGRRLSPNEMMEVTPDEAKALAIYGDIMDASKLPLRGAEAEDATKLRNDNAALSEENAKLKKQLAGLKD